MAKTHFLCHNVSSKCIQNNGNRNVIIFNSNAQLRMSMFLYPVSIILDKCIILNADKCRNIITNKKFVV